MLGLESMPDIGQGIFHPHGRKWTTAFQVNRLSTNVCFFVWSMLTVSMTYLWQWRSQGCALCMCAWVFGILPGKRKHNMFTLKSMGQYLTLSQTTIYDSFKVRVCRQQFKIWWKWQQILLKGRKHWEKEKLLMSNFSFSHTYQFRQKINKNKTHINYYMLYGFGPKLRKICSHK